MKKKRIKKDYHSRNKKSTNSIKIEYMDNGYILNSYRFVDLSLNSSKLEISDFNSDYVKCMDEDKIIDAIDITNQTKNLD